MKRRNVVEGFDFFVPIHLTALLLFRRLQLYLNTGLSIMSVCADLPISRSISVFLDDSFRPFLVLGLLLVLFSSSQPGLCSFLRVSVQIARECGVTASLVLLRWGLQHGCHLIPCSTKQLHLIENTHVFDFALDEDQMNRLDRLCDNTHFCWDPNIIA